LRSHNSDIQWKLMHHQLHRELLYVRFINLTAGFD
jgi:hypothetical protein